MGVTVKFLNISKPFFIMEKGLDIQPLHVFQDDLFVSDPSIDYAKYPYARALLWEDAHRLLVDGGLAWNENMEHDTNIVSAGYVDVLYGEGQAGTPLNAIRKNVWRLFLFQSESDCAIFKLRWK